MYQRKKVCKMPKEGEDSAVLNTVKIVLIYMKTLKKVNSCKYLIGIVKEN